KMAEQNKDLAEKMAVQNKELSGKFARLETHIEGKLCQQEQRLEEKLCQQEQRLEEKLCQQEQRLREEFETKLRAYEQPLQVLYPASTPVQDEVPVDADTIPPNRVAEAGSLRRNDVMECLQDTVQSHSRSQRMEDQRESMFPCCIAPQPSGRRS
ncbi:hypothetical protein JGG61_23535, partial [Salmonella enterica subsp. enterica serovar London]|nr:hypothetical protein [Salmonella enterica subsp. enterica serovar London]